MIILIIGINGFVGKHLESILVKNNHKIYGIAYNYHGKENYINCDIRNYDKLKEIILKIKPKVIVNLAALSTLKACEENPKLAKEIMVDGFENILRIVEDNKLDIKVLFTSSSQVYGEKHDSKINESDNVSPVSLYGKLKLEAENIVKKHSVKVIITRSFNHIGPGQQKGFITSDFASKIAMIENKGEGEMHVKSMKTIRDYTDVRDIAKAYYILIMKVNFGVYNVCSSKGYTGNELLKIMMKYSNAKIKIIEEKKKSGLDIKCLIGDNSKIKNIGWKPNIKIDKSLKDTLNYWRKNLE